MSADYKYSDLVSALDMVGVKRDRVLHIHSSLFSLGGMTDVELPKLPAEIYRALREVVGTNGTISVPAAFEDYARFGKPYDCQRSPVDRAQGVLSDYVVSLPEMLRTYCPMSAVAAVGPLGADIAHRWSASAYGTGSAWEGLLEHDAQICFLGLPPRLAFTFVMLIQYRFGVPYLYNKLYPTEIFEAGRKIDLPVTAAVRFLDRRFKIAEDCSRFERHLEDLGLIRSQTIGRGRVFLLPSAKKVFEEGSRMLGKDLYYFLKQPPAFVPGEIPTDGPTGAYVSNEVRFS